MQNLSPILRAAITSAIFAVCLLGFWYVKDVLIDKGQYHPNWMYVIVLIVISFASEFFFESRKSK